MEDNGWISKVFKGDIYFADFFKARDFGQDNGKGFPGWRVVHYGHGVAVQIADSVYLGPDGKPNNG